MLLLALFALGLVGATTSLLAWASVLPRMQAAQRLSRIGAYGLAAELPEAGDGASRPMLDSLARQVGGLVSRLLGTREEELRKHLLAAGVYRLTATALLGYRALAAVAMPLLIIVAAPAGWPAPMRIIVTVVAAWAGWAIPLVLLQRRARARLGEIDYALPGLIDLLVVTVEAGLGFSSSLQMAAERLKGPLGDELRLALHEQRMGLTTKDALRNLAARADSPGVRTFVRAILQGEELGVSIGQIMRSLAVDMRKLRRAMAEERAQKAPVKMLFPLVLLIFPSLFILLLGPALIDLLDGLGSSTGP